MIGKKMTALTGSAQTHPSSSHKAAPEDRTENIAVIKAAARTGQPLVSIPLDWSSLRMMRFIQAAKDSSPSFCCACSIMSRNSGSSRNWKGGLPRLSFLCVDTLITPVVMCLCVMTHYIQMVKKATPQQCLDPLPRRLTKPLVEVTVMAMNKHTQTRPRYQHRFLVVSRQDRSVPPLRLCTGAGSEQAVRCLNLSFVDPLPVQEAQNA